RAGLYRNRSQPRVPRQRQDQSLAWAARTRWATRAAKRSGPPCRRAFRGADRLPHRRNDLHRRRPGNESLMQVFERLERRRLWNEDERLILEQVRRVADTVIALSAEHYA